jgi:hypothetical protein
MKVEKLAEAIKEAVLISCEMPMTNGLIKEGEWYLFGIKFSIDKEGTIQVFMPEIVGVSPNSVKIGKAHHIKSQEGD